MLKTKGLLKGYCKYAFVSGSGNYWYENIYHETLLYQVYTFITFTIYTMMIFLENLAALFGKLPEVEKNSAVMFAAIHDMVLPKMYLLLYHKESIRKLNSEMSSLGEMMEEEKVMKHQFRKVVWGCGIYVVSVYLSLSAYGVESVRKSLVEAVPFYTVVTYLPYYEDDSLTAAGFRIFFYITWLYMMLPMMTADCMAIVHLITIAFKFKTLCKHFEKIKNQFDADLKMMPKKNAEEKMLEGFLDGIRMHQKLMFLVMWGYFVPNYFRSGWYSGIEVWDKCMGLAFLAQEIHRIFGIIMSLQVCESSAVAVLLLLRLALSPHMDLTNAIMTYTFVGSLFILLALNLWNAGEVTHQAALVSEAIYSTGWESCELNKDSHYGIRSLVLISMTQAQKPLILKAFGIQDLSYGTFVSVARMTYSVFAVFYQMRE